MRCHAFTLIELLIVVAIIAVLAAIALPNLLEAQVRARVSRVKSDMRTVATAMEGYAVDNNKYPPNYDSGIYDVRPGTEYLTFASLSTPIAYVTSTPTDVFRPDAREPSRGLFFDYVAQDSVFAQSRYSDSVRAFYRATGTKWTVGSAGPDKTNNEVGFYLDQWVTRTYDPTNGTVSSGDVWRSNLGQRH